MLLSKLADMSRHNDIYIQNTITCEQANNTE